MINKTSRMVPVYFAETNALKEEEPEVWQFLTERNLVVWSHKIEHKIRTMSAVGGIRSLTSYVEALKWFFSDAPEINSTDTEFNNRYGINVNKNKRDYYHSLLIVSIQRLTENTKTLSMTLHSYNVNFENNEDYIMKIKTKTILSKQ